MKFKVNAIEFYEGINPVLSVVPSRTTLPVLTNFILDVKKEGISAYATDLEVSVMVKTHGEVEEEGKIGLPAKSFGEIMKNIDGDVEFELLESHLYCRYPRGRVSFPVIMPEDYPEASIPAKERGFEIERVTRASMVEKTVLATASSERVARSAMVCVLFDIKDDTLKLVASDGTRLAFVSRKIEGGEPIKVIVPPQVLNFIKKMDDEKITVKIEEGRIGISGENMTVSARLIEEEYPDYEAVIPWDNDKILRIEKEKLVNVIKRVSIFATPQAKGIEFSLTPERMVVKAQSEMGEAEEELEGEFDGTGIDVTFNYQMLLEIIRRIEDERIEITLKEPASPTLIRGEGREDQFYLLMPLVGI